MPLSQFVVRTKLLRISRYSSVTLHVEAVGNIILEGAELTFLNSDFVKEASNNKEQLLKVGLPAG
jgi:hypothetical protein